MTKALRTWRRIKNRQRGNDHFFPHRSRQRVDGAVDEPRAVVGRDNAYPLGKSRLQLLNLFPDPLGHRQRVFSIAHEYHAAGHLAAVLFKDAAAELLAELNRGDTFHQEGRPAFHAAHHGVFQVFLPLDPADEAHQVLGVVLLHHAATGGIVASGDRRI
jgi:hypothetical protein